MINNPAILNDYLNPQNFGEKVTLSLTTIVIGLLVVFAVLTIIMLVIMLVGKIFSTIDKRKAEKAQPASVAQPEEPEVAVEASEEDEGALVAAITVAIAQCLEEPVGSFRVVSFKKTSTKPAWNKK